MSIKGGISKVKAKVDALNLSGKDKQPLVDFAFGTQKENFRGEIDFTYRHRNDVETKNLSIMANAYYDFPLYQTVKSFIGGGIGFSITEAWIDYYYYGNYGYSEKETELDLSWNIGVGLAIQANEKVNLDFSIRHINLGKIVDTKLETNEFLAGIRFNF